MAKYIGTKIGLLFIQMETFRGEPEQNAMFYIQLWNSSLTKIKLYEEIVGCSRSGYRSARYQGRISRKNGMYFLELIRLTYEFDSWEIVPVFNGQLESCESDDIVKIIKKSRL